VWTQKWDIPIYKEWVRKKKGQSTYELLIIRKEPKRYLLARAEWAFKSAGLPNFRTLESLHVITEREAMKKIREWKKQYSIIEF
jgi:hypothetical protein